MAPSKSIFSSAFLLLLLILLAFFLTHNFSSGSLCISGEPPAFRLARTRKMLREMKKKMGGVEVDGGKRLRRPAADWDQLRRVPSGPDPLHHNGGSPKKPRTP